MELGEVRLAFSAEKLYFTKDLGFVTITGEATVFVLEKTAGQDNTIGNFKKIFIITTDRTGDPGSFGRSGLFLQAFQFLWSSQLRSGC